MAEKMRQNMLSVLDFCIEVFKEKIEGKGEDSFYYSVTPEKAVFSVFDGCGGSGARRYEKLQGRTGAYMASRVISGATKDWFDSPDSIENGIPNVEMLTEKMQEYLAICKREGETTSSIKGRMLKAFPTTAAVIVCTLEKSGVCATCIWAGDSRCYLLNSSGLMQLTDDDVSGLDAMENLTADGGLTNVISASSRIKLHSKQINITKPCLLFAATDGCFGYLTTPMEFEFLLVDTLLNSKSISELEDNLQTFLQNIAGDDFSLCGGAFGYGTFDNLQNQFKQRRAFLLSEYIEGIETKTIEEKTGLWKDYSENYSKYLRKYHAVDVEQPLNDKYSTLNEHRLATQPYGHGLTDQTDENRPASRDEGLEAISYGTKEQLSIEAERDKPVSNVEKPCNARGLRKPTDLD